MGNTQTWGAAPKLTFDDVWKTLMETDRQIRETDQQIRERLGELERKYGKMIDSGFITRIRKEFKALGFVFERFAEKTLFENREHHIYAQADVFLENRRSAVAVTVKTRPGEGPERTEAALEDIKEQVERMEKLRRYFELHGDRRKLYGAVAGKFPKDVLGFALEQGLYGIECSEGAVKIWTPIANSK
jgi:hypothetical protein